MLLTISLNMFVENLVKLGFTEREAKAYLMLLRIGPSPVSSLAKRTNMKRVTVYSVLESLLSRGIVTYEQSCEGRIYIPHDPECLMEELDKEKAGLNVKMAIARDCVLEFAKSSAASDSRPNAAFYKDQKGVCTGFLDFLTQKSMLTGLLLFNEMPTFLLTFLKSLESRKGLSAFLVFSKEVAEFEKEFRVFRVQVAKIENPNHHALFVQGDHVFFLHLDPAPRLIVITDKAYADYVMEVLIAPFLK